MLKIATALLFQIGTKVALFKVMRLSLILTLILSLVAPLGLWAQTHSEDLECGTEEASLNLFQIHHNFDESGKCLIWKTKREPRYIHLNVPPNATHLTQDSASWDSFDYYEFCYQEDRPEKLQALLDDLKQQELLSFEYRNLNHQFGILNSLTYNISRALTRKYEIYQNGIFYYSLFDEFKCLESSTNEITERYYPYESLELYEETTLAYNQLILIISKHFNVIERHSFLPEPLEDMN